MLILVIFWAALLVGAQEPTQATEEANKGEEAAKTAEEADDAKLIPELKYKQQPGLAYAASKIYFSDQRYSVSGFGEVNAVRYAGESNRDSGDIELYYTNLYRISGFFGYKFSKRVIFNGEFLYEFLHDGTREIGRDIVIEAMLDVLGNRYFNTRFGYFPIPIGYINNNDEPVMFNSVNRPEVERIIIPSSWVALGAMAYGSLSEHLSYSAVLVEGLNGGDFVSGSWIRQGRGAHGVPKDAAFGGQLLYSEGEEWQFGLSTYGGSSGIAGTLENPGRVRMPTAVHAAHGRYAQRRYSITGVYTRGRLGRTVEAFERTGQVLGARTDGRYLEADYDVLPWFVKTPGRQRFRVFSRLEWLNTHASTDGALLNQARTEQDLRILTFGTSYAPKRNLMFKANYQFRTNNFKGSSVPESNLAEFGMGFIF